MPMISGEAIFMLGVWLVVAFWIVLGLLLVLHFFMPKQILEKYFKPPYFREAECHLFTGIPYAPIRTIMFMAVLAFPERGKKRGLANAHTLSPKWYNAASRFIIIGLLVTSISILLVVFGFFIYFLFS
jgi:hypothetical protein